MKPGHLMISASVVLLLLLSPRSSLERESSADSLSFEVVGRDNKLVGWFTNPAETVSPDSTIVHGGRFSARIHHLPSSRQEFSVLTWTLPIGFTGASVEYRGWLRTQDVSGFAGLWMREDGSSGTLQFDNMEERHLSGTTPWTEYRINLPLDNNAKVIYFGALLSGQGIVHVDDLQLLIDGKPVHEAPPGVRLSTAIQLDHEFDKGSKIQEARLSANQIDNLVLLGRIWGFLKYHHPLVMGGKRHWDYDLFRVAPAVLNAHSSKEATQVLSKWVQQLGEPGPCQPCATNPDSVHLLPRLDWIRDRTRLGDRLSEQLIRVYKNRPSNGEQFYVSQVQGVRNPDFSNETTYDSLEARNPLPDPGFRLLALFRFWNIVEYWFPYRDLIPGDWDGVMQTFIPELMKETTLGEYRRTMLALVACAHDGHANVWSAIEDRPPTGRCRIPVNIRFIEGRFVVAGFSDSLRTADSSLNVGDVIIATDEGLVDSLAAAWAPYYGASNETARKRDIARALTKGSCGPCSMIIEREKRRLKVIAQRDSFKAPLSWHDLPGETFRLLSNDVAYLKLSTISAKAVPEYIQRIAETRCLVLDLRNYPKEFMPFEIGQYLVERATPFARFTRGDLTNPGAFIWTDPIKIEPAEPHYKGKIAILVDEASQSQAEYTAMAFRAAPNAIVVGSTTAGADGNVSRILLPGGLRAMMSGIGVFYPDKGPTQGVGIVPDLFVEPTLKGIVAGRDEVLEAALERLLGKHVQIKAGEIQD